MFELWIICILKLFFKFLWIYEFLRDIDYGNINNSDIFLFVELIGCFKSGLFNIKDFVFIILI